MAGIILSLANAAAFADARRRDGKTIVTTNGAFDLLHAGHIFLLEETRKHGDILIVGVNSDASVRRCKGKTRPIEREDMRAQRVAKHADAVFIFDQDDPRSWLPIIRPNVHANAEIYGEHCIEAPVLREINARLVLIPIRPELGSTTEILQTRSTKTP